MKVRRRATGFLALLAGLIWVGAFFNVFGQYAAAANMAAVLLLLAGSGGHSPERARRSETGQALPLTD